MIELDPRLKRPLYEQLYAALADEIRRGDRAPGTPLPGRRTMAAQQGVSVNTVDTAYQMLAAEGLAEPRPRSGFYVQKTYGMLHTRTPRPAPQAVVPAAPEPVGEPATLFDLSTGSVDTALFPARSWGRIQKELLYQRPELLQRGEMQGDADLRGEIAHYLSDADKKNTFDVDSYLSSLRRKKRRVITEDEPFDLYDIELSDEDFAAE